MEAYIGNIHNNIMGTTSFDMRIQGMRKNQEFIVYPVQSGASADRITIQSGHRFGYINLTDGTGEVSTNHAQYANGQKFAFDKMQGNTVCFSLRGVDVDSLRLFIFTTAGNLVASSVVLTDNGGAINTLNA